MVDSQVRTNKVTDAALIAAMRDVPREDFVPKSMKGVAYLDEDLQIGDGRFLMEPMVLARLIQALELDESDVVLDIGGATGYGAAVMTRLACAVVAVDADLSATAAKTIDALEITNVVPVAGPHADGYPKQAPYNAILFEGSVVAVPESLRSQVADGGCIGYVEREGSGPGRAVLLTRHGDLFGRRVLFDASVPMLPGFEREPEFIF